MTEHLEMYMYVMSIRGVDNRRIVKFAQSAIALGSNQTVHIILYWHVA